MAVNPPAGSNATPSLRRRRVSVGNGRCLPEVPARTREEGQTSSLWEPRRDREPRRSSRKGYGPGEGQRAQSSQGCWQRPEQLKRAFCPELIRFDSVRAVRAPSALSVLQASAGPFGRFWREYKSCRNRVASASLLGTRAFSSSSCEECMLFPSLLPIWESCSLRDDEARSKLRSGSRLSGPCSVSWSVGPLLLRMPYNR